MPYAMFSKHLPAAVAERAAAAARRAAAAAASCCLGGCGLTARHPGTASIPLQGCLQHVGHAEITDGAAQRHRRGRRVQRLPRAL